MSSSMNVDQFSSKDHPLPLPLPHEQEQTTFVMYGSRLEHVFEQWISEQNDQDDHEAINRQGFDHG